MSSRYYLTFKSTFSSEKPKKLDKQVLTLKFLTGINCILLLKKKRTLVSWQFFKFSYDREYINSIRLKKMKFIISEGQFSFFWKYMFLFSRCIQELMRQERSSCQLGESWFSVGSISRVINHITCYKFECSHWLKLQHSDWRANLVKDFFLTNKISTNERPWIFYRLCDF